MEARDYANRTYLSAIEAARFLGVSVRMVHRLTAEGLSLESPPHAQQANLPHRDALAVRGQACDCLESAPFAGKVPPVRGAAQRTTVRRRLRADCEWNASGWR
jgi:hypothetical protein